MYKIYCLQIRLGQIQMNQRSNHSDNNANLEQEKELNPDAREPKANNNLLTKAEELAKDKCK